MMKLLTKRTALATMFLGTALGLSSASAEFLIGVNTRNELVTFDSSTPGNVSLTTITGLQSGESLLGIDRRPANGLFYGLTSASRLYQINAATGAATRIGSDGAFTLSGTSFGIDFNPVPDRIRVVNDTDQNLRLNPNDGTLTATDGNLAYAAGDVNVGRNPLIVAVGYINSVAGAATTTLFGIDSDLNILVTQNPPNAGTLNTVGSLGFDTAASTSLDVSGLTGIAYLASSNSSTVSTLYTVNLATGAATSVGVIGGGADLIGLTAAVPEPTSLVLLGLGVAGLLGRRMMRRRTAK